MTPTLTGSPVACFGAPRSFSTLEELTPLEAVVDVPLVALALLFELPLLLHADTSTTAPSTPTTARRQPPSPRLSRATLR